MHIKFSHFITSEPFINFLYRFIMVYSRTFRLRIENEKEWVEYLKNGGTVLLCTWHQQFFSAIRYFQSYNIYKPSIMISESRDGEIVAGLANRAGWYPVRGSSSRSGRNALKSMITKLKETRLACHIVDGPKGPFGKVKAGVIRLAHVTDAVIVPFNVSAENAWKFRSWDKFILPKPFSKVSIRFDKMIKFNKVKEEKSFEEQRKQLEKIMLPALNF